MKNKQTVGEDGIVIGAINFKGDVLIVSMKKLFKDFPEKHFIKRLLNDFPV